ncbi:MAG: LON peptidase substrate-binding domain-containing protein [Myxococcota bacterium]
MTIPLDTPEFKVFELDSIPLFPLPNAVLFPQTTIQLHIFEQRYRRMTEDALAGDLPLAIGLIQGTGRRTESGRPDVYPVVGVGEIVEHSRMDDGRFQLNVRGVGRVRIVEELPVRTPYRQIRGEHIRSELTDPDHAQLMLKTIQNCLFNVQADSDEVTDVLMRTFRELDSPGAISDVLGAIVFSNTRERQQMLAEPNVNVRLEALRDRLAEMIANAFEKSDSRDELPTN